MEGGVSATIERALKNKRVVSRLKETDSIIIDEVSMISGPTLKTAEEIARRARSEKYSVKTNPWGGIKVIAVGDFAQLPPVNPFSTKKEWAFLDPVWDQSEFTPVFLNQSMRATDPKFLEILNSIRIGDMNDQIRQFLNSRTGKNPTGEFTCLFPRRENVEKYNLERLEKLSGPVFTFQTDYSGKAKDIETFRKHSPVSDIIQLKKNALVMLRQNDNDGRWVNGTLAIVQDLSKKSLFVKPLSGKAKNETIEIEESEFTLLDAEGEPVVTASNFPVSLAWAMTIHKAQGATIDRMRVDLRSLWEPGQAYVALSRARDPDELYIDGWSERTVFADKDVTNFHSNIFG